MANRSDKRTQGAIEARGDPDTPDKVSRYVKIIEAVFHRYWKKGKTEFTFERGELEQVCEKLLITVPKNLGRRNLYLSVSQGPAEVDRRDATRKSGLAHSG